MSKPPTFAFEQEEVSPLLKTLPVKVNHELALAISPRLRAHKPDINSITNRINRQNSQEPGSHSLNLKPLQSQDHQKGLPEPIKLVKFERTNSKNHSPSKTAGRMPLLTLVHKHFGKDSDRDISPIQNIAINALATRDSQQNSPNKSLSVEKNEKIQVAKHHHPTMKDLKAFYPKARALVRERTEENPLEIKTDRAAVEDLDRWDNDYKQSLSIDNLYFRENNTIRLELTEEELHQRRSLRSPRQEKQFEPQMNSNVINMIDREDTQSKYSS